jgi:hypothetical protein
MYTYLYSSFSRKHATHYFPVSYENQSVRLVLVVSLSVVGVGLFRCGFGYNRVAFHSKLFLFVRMTAVAVMRVAVCFFCAVFV